LNATPRFEPWSWPHLAILAAIPVAATALAWMARNSLRSARVIRLTLGWGILVNELIWYVHCIQQGLFHPPRGIPLELCDLTLWLSVFSLLTLSRGTFNVAYYWALAGSTMALLTPDLAAALPSYPAVEFFAAHGAVVAGILYLVWSGTARPRPGSWVRAFMWLNFYAIALGIFNKVFATNYGYLCQKPAHPSLLDFAGPWPRYLLAEEALALALFYALGWPYRKEVS
jgi:hypothetical integral membrane protein (TIGR02206 family)